MNHLEKKIEEAAKRYSETAYFHPLHETVRKLSFIEGAKSEEAKEFHVHALKIEMVAKCAKMQVELKKNLYTEDEIMEKVLTLLNERYGILNPKKTISEILKQTLYTEEEVLKMLQRFDSLKNNKPASYLDTQEWFKSNKKK